MTNFITVCKFSNKYIFLQDRDYEKFFRQKDVQCIIPLYDIVFSIAPYLVKFIFFCKRKMGHRLVSHQYILRCVNSAFFSLLKDDNCPFTAAEAEA